MYLIKFEVSWQFSIFEHKSFLVTLCFLLGYVCSISMWQCCLIWKRLFLKLLCLPLSSVTPEVNYDIDIASVVKFERRRGWISGFTLCIKPFQFTSTSLFLYRHNHEVSRLPTVLPLVSCIYTPVRFGRFLTLLTSTRCCRPQFIGFSHDFVFV